MDNPFGDLKGIELDIDPAIQEICKTSNDTSSSTRSVLYIMVIVNILAFAAVINTHRFNWAGLRGDFIDKRIDTLERNLFAKDANFKYRKDSIALGNPKLTPSEINSLVRNDTIELEKLRHQLDFTLDELRMRRRNEIENYDTMKIPILGNGFDINNIGILGGITFLILLLIVRFTQIREMNNLVLAFHSISQRYPADSYSVKFERFLNEKEEKLRPGYLSLINFTRRKHHYNFLSMNEIFNLPPLETNKNATAVTTDRPKEPTSFVRFLVLHMYWMPFVVYLLIFLNDLTTIDIGWRVSAPYTIFGLILELCFVIVIGYASNACTNQKKEVNDLYVIFKSNNYTYTEKDKR